MSLNVLIIPEDPRNDSHILKPIIRALLAYVGKPHANIHFPIMKVGGVDHATSWSFIKKVVGQYRQADLFLLCVDRDNVVGRKQALTNIEQQSAQILPPGRALFAENAWQEIEVWLLV